MSKNLFPWLFFAVVILLNNSTFGQKSTNVLTLEDIYKNNLYSAKGFGAIRWMKDNAGYSTIENNASTNGNEIVRYEVNSGAKKTLVSATQLTPAGASKPLGIANYSWSEDNTKLLIFTNTRKVWRQNSKGDYWVLDLQTNKLSQLGKGLEEATLMFAKFSPDGTRAAYVSKLNIYVEDLISGKITKVTTDGGDNIINGTFDWVYEEELDCRDGFRWSPDGKNIAYWQSDTKNVGTFYMINNVDSIYSKPIPLPYPKVGTANSAVKVGVISALGGETKWFKVPGDPTNNYLARMEFIPASDEVMIQQLNRLQNTNTVWIGNIKTMALTAILADKDDAYLDLHDNIVWLENNQSFTWTSEKDGWLHLYKVSRDGKQSSVITKGNFDVVNINCIDPKGGYVYYIASPENFTQRYLYRSRIDGKGEAERVSPKNLAGQHSYQISDDAQYAIHTFENAATPRRISLINLHTHTEIKLLQDNAALKAKMAALALRPKEFFKVDIGEVVLDAWVIKPKNFDAKKKYPVIFHVYGEPAGSTVQDNWGTGDNFWHQYLANQGYVVMSVDNRGTKVPRGRDFRKCIYRQIGLLAADDQAKAAKKIMTMYPFVDAKRIGIWGWSGGGQMSLHCMFRHADIYKTGIAVSFVAHQTLYDNIYQERYMGLPSDNAEGYREGSPVTHSGKLKGNLMIIHGTADDNVHYQNFELLVNELIKNNKLFSMLSYPMRDHGINQRENTTLHMRRSMEKFWKDNL
ncbi:S9 family peptidase [Runella slithyformis]|uniref:Dipeptidyl-peptidase IV n=1 Tax=Runella slithyformis (strain ATCC 29530 / DSM 19594 / LMG 11500 / NCIMB 11436 / LSU 4) TaxID=761193 RepID=A0A7U3ZNP8_RUNSL|nr:S9 family peptidase [Runella slithyformis]AEI50569.1 Dipeptidyl-peptidase IV [Runella slithyformis DSM 19594]